jgi:hypothetical protein
MKNHHGRANNECLSMFSGVSVHDVHDDSIYSLIYFIFTVCCDMFHNKLRKRSENHHGHHGQVPKSSMIIYVFAVPDKYSLSGTSWTGIMDRYHGQNKKG